jgi:hypothetical protein
MDENVSGLRLADTLNAHGEQHGCMFVAFPSATYRGAPDEEVPGIAREMGATALLSINVTDFGAKEQYFRALVAAGVSVVSLRIRSSDAGDREYITDTLTKHVRKVAKILSSTEESVVISVDKSKARPASLQQILDKELP